MDDGSAGEVFGLLEKVEGKLLDIPLVNHQKKNPVLEYFLKNDDIR